MRECSRAARRHVSRKKPESSRNKAEAQNRHAGASTGGFVIAPELLGAIWGLHAFTGSNDRIADRTESSTAHALRKRRCRSFHLQGLSF